MSMLLLSLLMKGVPMSIERIHKLLNSSRHHIKINTDLLKVMDTDEAILYSYLVPMFQKGLKQQDFRFFNDTVFVTYNTDLVESMTGLSPFRQRNALNRLQKKNLLSVKLGQARSKYVSINENYQVLERMLYGFSVSSMEEAFYKCLKAIEEHSSKTNNNINIDHHSFLKYLKDAEAIDISSMGLGWLAKNTESKIEEKLCV